MGDLGGGDAGKGKGERGRVTYEGGEILETVRLLPLGVGVGVLVLQDERDFDNPGCPGRHQGVPEYRMYVGTKLQALRMRTHPPPRKHNHQPREEIPLRPSIPRPAQPYPQQPSAPPYNPHARMLQIILHPRAPPSMFRKRINAPPNGDEQAVEKLLTAARSFEPELPHEQQDGENDAVADEGGAHYKMRKTLS